MRDQIERSARHLYGLVHARYIVTTRGLAKMVSLQNPTDLTDSRRWRSTSKQCLGSVQESYANRNLCCLWVSTISPTCLTSSSTAPNVKTCTTRNPRDTVRLMVHISGQASTTFSSRCIRHYNHRRHKDVTSPGYMAFVCMLAQHSCDGKKNDERR